MAAVGELRTPEIIDLREVHSDALDDVLSEEMLAWRSQLYWDFAPSADLVRRFVRIQALNGFALVVNGRCAGYSYYVCEDGKALVGDLFIKHDLATAEREDALLGAVLRALAASPSLRRIEAQLMMVRGPFERDLPFARFLTVHPRNLMVVDSASVKNLHERPAASVYKFANWSEEMQDEGAQLIAAAYRGHVDATINDQYRTITGARRFLTNIVQYPGCGTFDHSASFVALNPAGRFVGLSLASIIAEETGHITQICVAPDLKGTGLGYELLRRSLVSLAGQGCSKTSLTVTASNKTAMTLYQSVGFRAHRRFAAYVWQIR